MSAAAVDRGSASAVEGNTGQESHGVEAGAQEGGNTTTHIGSPFGRAVIQMVDHDVLVEIAQSQERMCVTRACAAPPICVLLEHGHFASRFTPIHTFFVHRSANFIAQPSCSIFTFSL